MKTLLVTFVLSFLIACENKIEQNTNEKDAKIVGENTELDEDCLPCCEECPSEPMTEMNKVLNDSINVIYVFMKGFDDMDCCIYGIAEFVNNKPFAENYKEQHVFLMDIYTKEITPNEKNLVPDELKEYVIMHEYMNKEGMKTTWDPSNTGKYSKFKKYDDL